MDSINNIFKERAALQKSHAANIRSLRDEGIKRFHDTKRINIRDKDTKELRLANSAELALILRNCPTPDLYPFYKECDRANSFSATSGGP